MGKLINFDENYFETIDAEEKAYFLGFISADGCVIERNGNCRVLSIHINKQDIDILEKFKKEINYEGEISMGKSRSRMCTIFCTSMKMFNDLSKYNVTPRKSRILKFPKLPENMIHHYMRGYFDGDGCVSIHKDKRFENGDRGQINMVSASYDFISKYVDIIVEKTNAKRNTISDRKSNRSYFVIDWGGLTDVENIYDFLYKNATVYSDRKKKKFDEVIKINSLKIRYRKKNKQNM